MRYVVDATRGGEQIAAYLRRWSYDLLQDAKGQVLDFGRNAEVDDLCRRIAANLELDLQAVDRQLRALLSARISLFLGNTSAEPDAELWSTAKPPTDPEILAGVFSRLLVKAKLPSEWEGQRFEP